MSHTPTKKKLKSNMDVNMENSGAESNGSHAKNQALRDVAVKETFDKLVSSVPYLQCIMEISTFLSSPFVHNIWLYLLLG